MPMWVSFSSYLDCFYAMGKNFAEFCLPMLQMFYVLHCGWLILYAWLRSVFWAAQRKCIATRLSTSKSDCSWILFKRNCVKEIRKPYIHQRCAMLTGQMKHRISRKNVKLRIFPSTICVFYILSGMSPIYLLNMEKSLCDCKSVGRQINAQTSSIWYLHLVNKINSISIENVLKRNETERFKVESKCHCSKVNQQNSSISWKFYGFLEKCDHYSFAHGTIWFAICTTLCLILI